MHLIHLFTHPQFLAVSLCINVNFRDRYLKSGANPFIRNIALEAEWGYKYIYHLIRNRQYTCTRSDWLVDTIPRIPSYKRNKLLQCYRPPTYDNIPLPHVHQPVHYTYTVLVNSPHRARYIHEGTTNPPETWIHHTETVMFSWSFFLQSTS
jgi:hypothetical protein